MSEALQAISRSLSDDVRALAAISHNVANLNTPGFRGTRAVASFDLAAGIHTVIDLRNGGLSTTARPLDLALQGRGFFTVERDGQVLLMRAGTFRVDADGRLSTIAGDRVLGTAGPIALPEGEVTVAADGTVRAAGREVARLQLVDVLEPSQLRQMGNGLFSFEGALVPATAQVIQGALERSNVEPGDEMLRLMETMRHAESVQRAMSMYDKVLDVGINKLGEN